MQAIRGGRGALKDILLVVLSEKLYLLMCVKYGGTKHNSRELFGEKIYRVNNISAMYKMELNMLLYSKLQKFSVLVYDYKYTPPAARPGGLFMFCSAPFVLCTSRFNIIHLIVAPRPDLGQVLISPELASF